MSDESIEGCLTVQIQRTRSGLGAAPRELQDGTFAPVQIGMVDPSIYDLPTVRGKHCRTTLSMRVDSVGNYVLMPVFLHRPLPDGCRVKQAQLTWRMKGARVKYKLCLTLSSPARQHTHPRMSAAVTVTIAPHVLYRTSEGHPDYARTRLQVATWSGDGSGSVELDERWWSEMDRVDHLHGIDYDDKSIRASLRRTWAMQLPGLRSRLLLSRREVFRLSARDLAARYGRITVETPHLAAQAVADDGDPRNAVRHRACAHSLIAEIKHQGRKAGCEVAVVVASGPTMKEARAMKIKRLRDGSTVVNKSARKSQRNALIAEGG